MTLHSSKASHRKPYNLLQFCQFSCTYQEEHSPQKLSQ
uniref:Uncharacterized protein n=1 Tax=Rhizophora mucronata TaxID=61149 RepID=A0A2P2QPY8_RHIMU